jgi:acetylornithine deacetylase/succinyl-diaminopimelate desuccinylase-like protein
MKANSPMGKRYCAELLQKLVDIPSVFPNEEELTIFLERELATLGLQPQRIEVEEGRFNLLCRIGEGSPRICLNAHVDTVPANGASTPGARIDGDVMYGLGSCDDKASVAAIVTAGLEIASRAGEFGGGVDILFSVDEEHGGRGVEAAIAQGYKCDYAIVGEPSDLDLVRAHNGLTWITLTTHGVAAHGSAPWIGINAIDRMMEVVRELKEAISVFRAHPITGPMSLNLGIIKGGDLPNRVPESCEAIVDIRVVPPVKMADLQEAVRPLLDSKDWLSYSLGKTRECLDTPEDSPLVKTLLSAASDVGVESKIIGGRGWTEAESFRTLLGIDAVVCGPGSMNQAHSSNEFVSISETQRAAELYVRAVERLLKA